jgi:hypothetical protein
MNTTEKNEHYHRKGAILGMTFAELLVLFLFLLLLILGTTIVDIDKRNEQYKNEISRYMGEAKTLDSIASLIKEKHSVSQLKKISDLKNSGNTEEAHELLMESSPLVQKKIKEIEKIKSESDQFKNTISNCKAQNTYLNKKLGGVHPPCWADDSGKVQYIYNIYLRDDGIWTKDNKIPSRAEEQSHLPLQNFKLNQSMQCNEFILAGRGLRKISDANNCKYYVRIYDETHPHNKEHYKKLKRSVEDVFFIWESVK